MTSLRLIRRALDSWRAWRLHRAVRRQHPELRLIDEAIHAARRDHRQVANLQAARTAFLHSALKGQI